MARDLGRGQPLGTPLGAGQAQLLQALGPFGTELLGQAFTQGARHFGIGAGVIDRLAGTATSPGSKNLPSPTVRNLSYDEGRAASFPWVAEGYAQKQSALATINDGPKPFKR